MPPASAPPLGGPTLVEALRDGDEAAFARLLRCQTAMLLAVARCCAPGREEQVVRDTWLAVIERLVDRGALHELAIGAISRLPARERAVIALRDVVGLPSEEVCDALGLPVADQRALLHRARTSARAALERHFDGLDGHGALRLGSGGAAA